MKNREGLAVSSKIHSTQFKTAKKTFVRNLCENVLNRQFQKWCVSDLTHVAGETGGIIAVYRLIFNRRHIGYSAGEHKTAELVKQAFMKVDGNLSEIHIFHTDRGNEFKNETIEELLETFHMERSLSHKGCPYDNAVAEATFKIIKQNLYGMKHSIRWKN